MKIVRDLSEDGNLNTSLYNLLSNFGESSQLLYYSEHKLRHPLAIYNRGASQFLNDYKRLIDFIIYDYSNFDEFNTRSFARYGLLRAIFGSFASFIDDTYSIFKCFYATDESSYRGKYNSRWFEKANPKLYERYDTYKRNIDTLSTFSEINNELKHANGRMSTLIINANYRGKSIGFFVEGLDDNGQIIPNIKFHKSYRNMRTAFSLTWFLYEILADFYFVCDSVTKIIEQIITDKGIVFQSTSITDDTFSESLKDIVLSLESACTSFLYYDEYETRPMTQITLLNNILTIQKPATKTFMKRFIDLNTVPCQITLGASGDGMSKSYGMVYYEISV